MAWRPKTLWEAIAPIAWLNWLSGLGTIEIPHGRPRPLLSRTCNLAFNIVYLSVVTWRMLRLPENWITYEKISYMFVLWTNVVVALYSILLAWFQSKRLKRIVMRCAEIDDTLEAFGSKKRYGKIYRLLIVIIVLWFGFLLLLTIMDYLWFFSQFGTLQAFYITLILHLPVTVNSVVDLTFIGMVGCIGSRISKLNILMSDVFRDEKRRKYGVKDSTQVHRLRKMIVIMGYDTRKNFLKHFIETVKQVHLEIVRISHAINRAYALQILLEMAVQLTVLTGSLYNLYFVLTNPEFSFSERNDKLLALILWLVVCAGKVIIVSGSCATAASEAGKMVQIIREIDGLYPDEDLKEEIQQFSLQLILHPVYFTLSGFVRLNNEFTRMFFGTIATYLVIIIQMTSTPNAMKSLTRIQTKS